jgi:hypothetical protein
MTTSQLKRSFDRKVANLVTKNGKQAAIANTFGLPAGKNYSCPGATSVCESVCYAGKLEKLYKAVKANLIHNWELLKDADESTMIDLLQNMIVKRKMRYCYFVFIGTVISLMTRTPKHGNKSSLTIQI